MALGYFFGQREKLSGVIRILIRDERVSDLAGIDVREEYRVKGVVEYSALGNTFRILAKIDNTEIEIEIPESVVKQLSDMMR